LIIFEELETSMYFKKSILPYLLLLSIAALAFFQVVFFVHPPNYDMVDCFYPWRFHVGECFQNGQFPFWNPFQDLGYPIYADPSSGAWYPVVWLIGSTVGYNIYTIGFEFYLHVFFAGVGMYWLAQTLNFDKRIALITGVTYMLCGIFVGNAQHLPYIIGAAWLPFVLNFYFRLLAEKEASNGVYAGFFLFLMITGGYPAFVIVLFYFFLASFSYYIFKSWRSKKKNSVYFFLINHIVFVVSALVFSAGMLISIYQVSPYLSRLEGFTLEQALYSPFAPKAFISFLLPFSTVDFPEIFKGDISMINGYFGLFMLFFLFAGIFAPKNSGVKFIFVLGIFSLLAAVGDALPVRELLYKYVPMMDVFRFPAVFRIFALFAFILVGANYLNLHYKKGKFLSFRKWIIPLSVVLLALIGIIIYIRSNSYLDMKNFIGKAVFDAYREGQIEQFIVLQASIQIGFIIALILLIRFIKKIERAYFFLGLLIALDLIVAAQLNGPYTVYTSFLKSNEPYQATAKLEKGFPPLQNITIEEAGKLPGLGQPYWQNLNNFHKEISAEGFNSFSFSSYDNLESKHPFIYKTIQQNKVVMLSDKVLHEKSMDKLNANSSFLPNQLIFDNQAYSVLSLLDLKTDSTDRATITNYSANHFDIQTENKESQLLTIFQKEYAGWEAKVDGEKVPIYKSNKNFMTIVLPADSKKVTFQYRNPVVLIAFLVSLLSCLLLLANTLIFKGATKSLDSFINSSNS
jgi:hypothetical protein